jgi:hypothetical protein
LNRYFLKVQCKLNGSGLQYVRVRGVLSSRKSCTMTSQDSWMFRKLRRYWVSRVPSTQSPLSSTDLL